MKKLMLAAIVLAVVGMVFASTTFADARILAVGEQTLTAAIGPQEDGQGDRDGNRDRPERRGKPRRGPQMALRALVITQDAKLAALLEKSVAITGQMHELKGKTHAIFAKMVQAAKTGDRKALKALSESGKELRKKEKAVHEKMKANREAIETRLKELKPQIQDKMKEFRGKRGEKNGDQPAPERDAPPALD
jgi:erythromycin esterase-like protein